MTPQQSKTLSDLGLGRWDCDEISYGSYGSYDNTVTTQYKINLLNDDCLWLLCNGEIFYTCYEFKHGYRIGQSEAKAMVDKYKRLKAFK